MISQHANQASARFTPVLLSLAILVTTTASVAAQAVCSAPHSSPTLAQSGSIQTLAPGTGWIQLSLYGQHADERYDSDGHSVPFSVTGAEFDTRSVFLSGGFGVVPGLEVWGQVPTHRLSVGGSLGGSNASTGVGDLRGAVRISPELVGLEFPIAVRLGAKVPGSDFKVDATVIPLSEGQRDLEVSIESGASLGDFPLYVFGWVGYRWRAANESAAREPGDERFAHLAFGGGAGGLTWEVAADGLWGKSPIAQGLSLSRERRRLIQILPTVGYGVGPGRLEATGQLPVAGRNLPASIGLSVGYRLTWGM